MPTTALSDWNDIVCTYVRDTRALSDGTSVNEPSYYPDIRNLIGASLGKLRLPFDVKVNTSESGGMPDFVLGELGSVGVYGEVKLPHVSLEDMAYSTSQNDQIGRYLSASGVVLLCNVRGFGLLVRKESAPVEAGEPVPPEHRDLIQVVDLWSGVSGEGAKSRADEGALEQFAELLARTVTDYAALSKPADLAKVLAREARDAKDELPENLAPISALLDDFALALGLSFEVDDPKGDRFLRSSLVQTAFYSLFAAWVLWDRDAPPDADFSLTEAEDHLSIPFLQELFHDLRSPLYLKNLGLAKHLERAVATLRRIDRDEFRKLMTFPTASGEDSAVAAITYFYEPFLEAFDPELREQLGVWYTPPEIVRYQVQRVHYLLKTELGIARGLAAQDVVVLDPCCGTGAYLLEVARCITEELQEDGAGDTLALELLDALTKRVIGFEILTAPFAIAQLQLYMLLSELGVKPSADQRLSVYLTNALTGWSDERGVKITFPEMKQEFDASQSIKQKAKIIVVLGNPPYDRFAGVAQAEEADLVAAYKGVQLKTQKNKDGSIKRDNLGNPIKKQVGNSELYEVWGIRKQLLDDLYVRFFRMAEERIGLSADSGIVSFISNSSWLTGRSHPIMRQEILRSFDSLWIDNLNGDKFATGKVIPADLPGGGKRDESVFTTAADPRGIQPGTAISTLLKRKSKAEEGSARRSESDEVRYRDYWGIAANKRQALLESLPDGKVASGSGNPDYLDISPSVDNRWRLAPHTFEGGYENWPALDQLFPERYQGVNSNRGLTNSLIDTNKDMLAERVRAYLEAETFEVAQKLAPEIATKRAGYKPENVWEALRGTYDQKKVKPILLLPFDCRSIYYETEHKLLNRSRPELGQIDQANEFLVTVPEPRKVSEAFPIFSSALPNLHVHERGSVVIPKEVVGTGLYSHRLANITESAWKAMRDHFGLEGRREDDPAREFVGKLFRAIFALLHSPQYQEDHKSALSADWAHPPIPRDAALFDELVEAGGKIVELLDAETDASPVFKDILEDMAKTIGPIQRVDGQQVQPADLAVTITYWGGGKGRWRPRAFKSEEHGADALGQRTGDLYINDDVYFSNVPENVWDYNLGGYPVIKKWLGYRQANRRNGGPLTLEEANWLRKMIQRISAILTLGGDLDELYLRATEDAFNVNELGLD